MSKVDRRLRTAYEFFKANAGNVVGESSKGALMLARAEREARELELVFEWHDDPDADWSWMDETEAKIYHEVYYCTCKDPEGEVLASLGSIFDPSEEYRRVVEAELAMEAVDRARNLAEEREYHESLCY